MFREQAANRLEELRATEIKLKIELAEVTAEIKGVEAYLAAIANGTGEPKKRGRKSGSTGGKPEAQEQGATQKMGVE